MYTRARTVRDLYERTEMTIRSWTFKEKIRQLGTHANFGTVYVDTIVIKGREQKKKGFRILPTINITDLSSLQNIYLLGPVGEKTAYSLPSAVCALI